jgi:membrane associated rhomboid family serine protease
MKCMARPGEPITMTFPPFAGAVRALVLANVAVFFAMAVLAAFAPRLGRAVEGLFLLHPSAVAHGELWQLATYSFFHFGALEMLFAMLTLWFCGSMLEGAYGSR